MQPHHILSIAAPSTEPHSLPKLTHNMKEELKES